jgi:hypothetical protein
VLPDVVTLFSGGADISDDDITYGSLCCRLTLVGIDVGLCAGRGPGPPSPRRGAVPLLILCDGDGGSLDACVGAMLLTPNA